MEPAAKAKFDITKLKEVVQESKADTLQTEDISDEEVGSCAWIIESRNRKGEACGKNTFDGKEYCTVHEKIVNIRNAAAEAKPEVKESIEVVEEDENVTEKKKSNPPKPKPPKATHERAPAQGNKAPKNVGERNSISVEDMMGILKLFSTTMVEMTKSLRVNENLNGHD